MKKNFILLILAAGISLPLCAMEGGADFTKSLAHGHGKDTPIIGEDPGQLDDSVLVVPSGPPLDKSEAPAAGESGKYKIPGLALFKGGCDWKVKAGAVAAILYLLNEIDLIRKRYY